MHYCCHLFTRVFPTDDVIAAAMASFNSEEYYKRSETDESVQRPVFTWDYWIVGGRYGGQLKLDSSLEKYEPGCFSRTRRAGQLFRNALLERATFEIMELPPRDLYGHMMEEVYALRYCGGHENALRVDGALMRDLTNLEEIADQCFCAVDVDGTAYARDIFDGEHFIDNPNFDGIVKEITEKNRNDCYLTVIDLHD